MKDNQKYFLYSSGSHWFAKFDTIDEVKKALLIMLEDDQYDEDDIKEGSPNNQYKLFVGREYEMEMNLLPDKLKLEDVTETSTDYLEIL